MKIPFRQELLQNFQNGSNLQFFTGRLIINYFRYAQKSVKIIGDYSEQLFERWRDWEARQRSVGDANQVDDFVLHFLNVGNTFSSWGKGQLPEI